MKKIERQILLASLAMVGLAFTARAHIVKTDVGNGADVQMAENNEVDGTGPAAINGNALNTRFSGTTRNDVVGLRFDLSGYTLSDMTNVSINLVNYRSNDPRYVAIYGVAEGTFGATGIYDTETWSDTTVSAFGDLPGLESSDGTCTTRNVDLSSGNVTLLADIVSVGGSEGAVDSITSSNLTAFVQAFAGTNITFIITQDSAHTSSGQYRFASREAASMTSISGAAGDFAPYLQFDLTTDAADTNAPSVVSVSPTNDATGVDLDVVVEVTFDETMAESSINTGTFVLLDATNGPVSASVSYSPATLTATLTPDTFVIAGSTTYIVTLTGGTGGVTDESGNPLPETLAWSFTTRALTAADPVRIVADADAYLTNGQGDSSPSTLHGSKSLWEVRWYDNLAGVSRIHIGYIRFDISSINPEEYAEIRLSGTFADGKDGPGTWAVWGLNDNVVSNELGRLGNDWAETNVCYANAAGISNEMSQGSWSVVSNETTYLGTILLDGGMEFNSNPTNLTLASFLAADTDGLVTLILMSPTIDGTEYRIDSKEGSSSGGHRPVTLDFIGSAAPAEPPVINSIAVGAGPSILVTWSGTNTLTYSVERSVALQNAAGWVAVATNIPGAAFNIYTDAPPIEAHAAYRIVEEGSAP